MWTKNAQTRQIKRYVIFFVQRVHTEVCDVQEFDSVPSLDLWKE
jgi:hypothetical protein